MNNKNCPQCGTQVADELPGGLCPACLMAAAKQSQEEVDQTRAVAGAIEMPSESDVTRIFPELDSVQFIGRGGMGAVFKVRQKNLDRVVALKVFLDRSDDPEFAARFQREARALARLNHPNIVTVHDFGVRDDVHYLIMEFIDGVNLRQLTVEEKLAPEMALQMIPQLCDALQYAHDNGVIHRDIKPENLLLDTRGNINIADFGLAKMTGNEFNGTLTRTQQVMGTFNYMAPEQRERPTEVDHRADIYSLGVVIYEMLTGELPLGRFQPPSSKSEVNARLDEVVMRSLEKEPDRRYQQASEFKTGFQTAGDFRPMEKPVPPVKQYANAGANANAGASPNANFAGGAAYRDAPRGTRSMFTIMSGREKKGDWVPGDPQLVFTMMGGTDLNLTSVQVDEVEITAFTLMGGVEIVVPHGAIVDLDGMMVMGATIDNVVRHPHAASNMRVRVRSWGAMGGCTVRTPKPEEDRAAAILEQRLNQKPLKESDRVSTLSTTLMAFYTMFCTLVTLAVPIAFVADSFHLLNGAGGKMVGVLVAIGAGLVWSLSGYVRILVGAGPAEQTSESIQDYYSGSIIGTLIRMLAMVVLFACPAMFIITKFDAANADLFKFAGIVCGIVAVALFIGADKVEEAIYGKTSD